MDMEVTRLLTFYKRMTSIEINIVKVKPQCQCINNHKIINYICLFHKSVVVKQRNRSDGRYRILLSSVVYMRTDLETAVTEL